MEQRTIPKIVLCADRILQADLCVLSTMRRMKACSRWGTASLPTLAAPDTLLPNCSALNAAAERVSTTTPSPRGLYHLLYTELAIRRETRDGSTETVAFRDGSVHAVLSNSGIAKVYPNEVNANEWFRTDLATVLNAIKAVKQGRRTLYASEITPADAVEILLRQERRTPSKTIERFRRGDSMLWNAKMRYGKTVTALSLVKRQLDKFKTSSSPIAPLCKAAGRKISTRCFAIRTASLPPRITTRTIPRRAAGSILPTSCSLKPCHKRQTLHLLRFHPRSAPSKQVGGNFNKNNAIFKMHWDLVINDEAHEGTQTDLGKRVTTELTSKDTKVLSLSGTPFNILYQYDDDSIYTWDYCMEQAMKLEWDKTHPGDPNPYASLPQMHIFTYELGDIIRGLSRACRQGHFTFAEFFRTWSGDPQKDGEDVPH